MTYKIILLFFLFFTQFLFAQTNEVWVRFTDSTSELSGYKDLKGNIKIPPKFEDFTIADSFYNIIAVNEKIGSSYKRYYLLKNGKKVGFDSVFIFDFTPDCESEGKILFKDKKQDRVGYFNKNGIPIIPAIYNYASPFFNGFAVACKNAKRKCWDGSNDTIHCEHLGWDGGELILINERNEILADSLHLPANTINWYSMRLNDFTVDTNIYINVHGRNNNVYSFIDYEKEFKKWFDNDFMNSINSGNNEKLEKLCFNEITYWNPEYGKWIKEDKTKFLQQFPMSILKRRFQPAKLKEVESMEDDLNTLTFDGNKYAKYINACGEPFKEKYPVFDVMITYWKKRSKSLQPLTTEKNEETERSIFYRNYETDYQEHFGFLRTDSGYKLLQLSFLNRKR